MYVVRFSHNWKPPSLPNAVAITPPELAPNKNKGVSGGIDLLVYGTNRAQKGVITR